MNPTDEARALKTQGLSKATLSLRLKEAGYTLSSRHWAHLDRLLKRGWILPAAVLEAAASWGWSEEQVKQLRKALR